MKVAITSEGNSPDSRVDSRFSRCSFFVIYDTDDKSTVYIPNPNKEITEGAGPASVEFIASKGVSKVVSGEYGAKVKSIFDQLQIQLIVLRGIEKRVSEVIMLLESKQ